MLCSGVLSLKWAAFDFLAVVILATLLMPR